MAKCVNCGTEQNIVHSGVDALVLECMDLIEKICYDCANLKRVGIRKEVEKVMNKIYEDNESHFEFMWNMGGGDCDCNLHQTMGVLSGYLEKENA